VRVDEVDEGGIALHFAVEDTGIGIPADKHKLIFDAFTQADGSTSRRYGGSGLGLAICARVVEIMHGRIWVDSAPGLGSTFHFTARFGRSSAMPASVPVAVEPGAGATRLRSLTILVVEDNAVNRLLATKLLEKDGHRVVTANDGREALETLARQRFDVVFMDVQMPVLNGFEATAAIRRSESGSRRHQFIVAVTAHALKGDHERCLEAGMDAYITKPLNRADIRRALAQAVEHLDRGRAGVPTP